MLKIGITGGIACGKSNITHLLKKKGYSVIDSDEISRRLSQKGGSIYEAILKNFGSAYFENGILNRRKLGNYIFQNEKEREKLNAITHPLIVAEMEEQIKNSKENILFLDIPLLFEAHLEYLCHKIICVFLPYEIQLKRLMERDGICEAEAIKRIESQESLESKVKRSDYTISTVGSFQQTEDLLDQLLEQLKGAR